MNKKESLINILEEQSLNGLKDFIENNNDFNFDFINEHGQNLLHLLAKINSENMLEMARILLEKGVDPRAVDEKFISAMDIAKGNNNHPLLSVFKFYVNQKNKEYQDLAS